MENQELVDFLKENGICQACQLRYLKARGSEYQNMQQSFDELNVKWEDLINVPDDNDDEQQPTKKQRLDTCCPTCLGIFSEEFQITLIDKILAADIAKYDCSQIVISISMPMLFNIRQLSMWYALINKFGKSIHKDRSPDVPIKEACKLILNPIICKQLKKTYDNTCNGIMINITLGHSDEESDVVKLKMLHKKAFPTPKGRKKQEVSRGVLEKQYLPMFLDEKLFEEFFPIPPTIPTEKLQLNEISLTGPTIFVAGRYRKLTRELSHTPWVLNGVRVMEDSIEEIIIRTIGTYFCNDTKKIIFMSSGREDVDVRCLGKGRPFVLEIPNSMHTKLPKAIARQMENDIDKSLKISVRNLQIVQREELWNIKNGEEEKRKFYRALCKLDEPVTVDILQKLNQPDGFEIAQKTPLRVLHRRPLHTRPRTIYSLKARVKPDNHRVLILDIVSQAGTYIKELVHGDFGRTIPSITSLIGGPIDILALDVVAIDLNWPPEIENNYHAIEDEKQ